MSNIQFHAINKFNLWILCGDNQADVINRVDTGEET